MERSDLNSYVVNWILRLSNSLTLGTSFLFSDSEDTGGPNCESPVGVSDLTNLVGECVRSLSVVPSPKIIASQTHREHLGPTGVHNRSQLVFGDKDSCGILLRWEFAKSKHWTQVVRIKRRLRKRTETMKTFKSDSLPNTPWKFLSETKRKHV